MFSKNYVWFVIFWFFTFVLFSCSIDNISTQLIGHYNYISSSPDANNPCIMNLDLKEKAQYHLEIINSEPNETVVDDGIWKVIKTNDPNGVEKMLVELTPKKSSEKKYFYLKNNTTLQLLESIDNPQSVIELKKIVH